MNADDVHETLKHLGVMFERERTLFGYEVHDGIVQYLVGAIMMQEQALQMVQAHAFDSAQERLGQSLALSRTAVDEARRMIDNRRPGALEQLGLLAAVRQLVAECQERHGVQCTFVEDIRFTSLSAPLETAIFRIVQEALSNALRHSNSRAVLVSINQRAQGLFLKVEDWGVGFDPESIEAKGVGLEGIR
jgi:signal transduction histidine kinase